MNNPYETPKANLSNVVKKQSYPVEITSVVLVITFWVLRYPFVWIGDVLNITNNKLVPFITINLVWLLVTGLVGGLFVYLRYKTALTNRERSAASLWAGLVIVSILVLYIKVTDSDLFDRLEIFTVWVVSSAILLVLSAIFYLMMSLIHHATKNKVANNL